MARNDEINDADLLMNTSIVYHTESLLEMQIICVIFFTIMGYAEQRKERKLNIDVSKGAQFKD